MWDRKQLKERGKYNFKKNYWSCVGIAFILSILLAAETKVSRGSGNTENFSNVIQNTGLSSGVLVAALIGGISIMLIVGILVEMFVRNILIVGGYRFFINNSREEKANFSDIISPYMDERFVNIFLTMLLTDLFTFLWSCLFVIPGIVKTYSYRMVPFILADHPEVGPTEAITMSRHMMKGQKWNAFILDLSFIGWIILTAITAGLVGIFYYMPYKYATDAELYEAVKYNA